MGDALFLRLLGAVYVVAFLSLRVQVLGLIGARGSLPLAGGVVRVVGASDRPLRGVCVAGAVCGAMAVLGAMVLPALGVAWIAYLSCVQVADVFLGYQWDVLLAEAGFLALLVPSRLGHLLV